MPAPTLRQQEFAQKMSNGRSKLISEIRGLMGDVGDEAVTQPLEYKQWPPRVSSDVKNADQKRALYQHTEKTYAERTKIAGAAGEQMYEQPPVSLRILTDVYSAATRRSFAECANTDPIIAPAIERRSESLFADGIEFVIAPSSAYDPNTGDDYTPEQLAALTHTAQLEYGSHIAKIKAWALKGDMLKKIMKQTDAAKLIQGNSCTLITPGIDDLPPHMMPSLKLLTYDTLREVVVDVGRTYKMVALNLQRLNKTHARLDEIVYSLGRNLGLRATDDYYASSTLESMLTISQAVKRLYNYNMPEAIIAAYLAKTLFKFDFDNSSINDPQQHMADTVKQWATRGNLAMGTGKEVVDTKPITQQTNDAMLGMVEGKFTDALLSVIGVPKIMLNKEHNLNRDIATIELITYMMFVRLPAEQEICEDFTEQLITPLLAQMSGTTADQMPIRLEVRTKTHIPTDPLVVEKAEEVHTSDVSAGTNIFGAAGKSAIDRSDDRMKSIETALTQRLAPYMVRYAKSNKDVADLQALHGDMVLDTLIGAGQAAFNEGQSYAYVVTHTDRTPTLTPRDMTAISDKALEVSDLFWRRVADMKIRVPAENDKQNTAKIAGAAGWNEVIAFQQAFGNMQMIRTALGTTVVNMGTVSAMNNVSSNTPDKQSTVFVWHTRQDSDVCKECRALEGAIMDSNDADFEEPPKHENCRCRLMPHA